MGMRGNGDMQEVVEASALHRTILRYRFITLVVATALEALPGDT